MSNAPDRILLVLLTMVQVAFVCLTSRAKVVEEGGYESLGLVSAHIGGFRQTPKMFSWPKFVK